jgi:hypothetical protein
MLGTSSARAASQRGKKKPPCPLKGRMRRDEAEARRMRFGLRLSALPPVLSLSGAIRIRRAPYAGSHPTFDGQPVLSSLLRAESRGSRSISRNRVALSPSPASRAPSWSPFVVSSERIAERRVGWQAHWRTSCVSLEILSSRIAMISWSSTLGLALNPRLVAIPLESVL